MQHLSHKLIIYDGACPLCVRLYRFVLRSKLLPREKMFSFYALPPAQQAQVDPKRFRNEMALIDLQGGGTIYGPDALRYIFAGKWRVVRGLFKLPGVMPLIRLVYTVIGANRYQLATPLSNMPACTCAPERPFALRAAYNAWNLLWAVLVTAFFGAALGTYFPDLSRWQGAGQMLLMAGTGWAVHLLIVQLFLRPAGDYVDHLSTVMRKGVMVLLPVTLLLLAFGALPWWLPVLSVLLSSCRMFLQHRLRVRALGMHAGITWLWFAVLQSTALAWVLFFHMETIF